MIKSLLSIPIQLGTLIYLFISEIGAMFIFTIVALVKIFSGKQTSKVIKQVYIIGANSVFLICLIGLFTGMVLGLQLYYALVNLGSEGVLGTIISIALIRELGPVLTAIMITARAGSAMTAEIGVMRISEQIDALEVMDIDPYSYLISPRMLACLFVFPLLTAIFDVLGIIGGYISSVVLLGLNEGIYISRVAGGVQMLDVNSGFVKSLVFGVIVTAVCCYKGFYAHMRKDSAGPEAVSNATTSAVVLSCVLILVFDYVITSLLL